MWLGAMKPGGIRRAAAWEGWIVVAMSDDGTSMAMTPDVLAARVEIARTRRRDLGRTGESFDIAVLGVSDGAGDVGAFEQAGATWWLESLSPMRGSLDGLLAIVRAACPGSPDRLTAMALEAFSRVPPILLLVGLGALIRRRSWMAPGTIDDLRRLILGITLPAALFLAFLRVDLEPRYGIIVASVFGACLVVLAVSPWLRRWAGIRVDSMPNLMAGFEAGMLGYALFAAVFGAAELYRFAIVDIGQVLFVFFVLATVVTVRASGQRPPMR
jgi:hypothetical protein